MTDDIPLDDLVASLAEGWEDQAPRQSPGMLGIRVINWRTLDYADAPEVWTDLREWVVWFTHRYNLASRKIPMRACSGVSHRADWRPRPFAMAC